MTARSYDGPVYLARCRGCNSLHEVTMWAAENYAEKGHCRIVCRTCNDAVPNNRQKADIEYTPDEIDRLESMHGEIAMEQL